MRMMMRAFLIIAVLSVMAFIVNAQVTPSNMFRKVSDFDGDGRADYAVTRNENGNKIWYVWQSRDGFRVFHWGLGTDTNVAGDYDGDGKTDFAVYREPGTFPPTYIFHILETQSNTYTQKTFTTFANFGTSLAHQDYNGDGRVDAALQTGEFGLITQLNVLYSGISGGFGTSIPPRELPIRIGDMDGDGRAEKAHYHINSNVVTITNLVTNTTRSIQFGISGDQYQMADFDGDGIGDLTVFRRGVWWWIRSSDNVVNVAQWGVNGDTPVPADYDGDGKTDLAIWRSGAQSVFWVLGSQDGIQVFPWGISNDQPVRF